jgi:hypothetical protein
MLKDINKMDEHAQVKVRIASALLYIMPWESSPKSAYSIEESLRKDLERTLRSPELKEQIDNYKQAFWLILLTPFSLVTLAAVYQIPFLILAIIGLIVGFALAYLLLKEYENTPTRILEYAFARWFQEGTSTDLSRRKSGFGRESAASEKLAATLEIVTPTIDLAVRGDWKGFDRKSRNLEELLGIPKPDCLSWRLITEFLAFLEWSAKEIHGPNSQRVDICLRNAGIQITDSIKMLEENRDSKFSAEEASITKVMKHILDFSSNNDKLLSFSAKFYEIFEEEIFSQFSSHSYSVLRGIPFLLNEMEIPEPRDTSIDFEDVYPIGLEELAFGLTIAAEQKLLDMLAILKLIASWDVTPDRIKEALGPTAIVAIMENDVGWTLDDIREINRIIAEGLHLVDFDKMIRNMDGLGKQEGKPSLEQYLMHLKMSMIAVHGVNSDIKEISETREQLDEYISSLGETA